MCARRLEARHRIPGVRRAGVRSGPQGGTGLTVADGSERCDWRGVRATQAPICRSCCRCTAPGSFGTGAGGDFEELVRRLEPRELPPEVGKRPMDISHPGFALEPAARAWAPGTVIGLEGALRVIDTKSRRVADEDARAVPGGTGGDPEHTVAAGHDDGAIDPVVGPAHLRQLARRPCTR